MEEEKTKTTDEIIKAILSDLNETGLKYEDISSPEVCQVLKETAEKLGIREAFRIAISGLSRMAQSSVSWAINIGAGLGKAGTRNAFGPSPDKPREMAIFAR